MVRCLFLLRFKAVKLADKLDVCFSAAAGLKPQSIKFPVIFAHDGVGFPWKNVFYVVHNPVLVVAARFEGNFKR